MELEVFLNALSQLLAVAGGILGVPVIEYLKNRLGLESDASRLGLAGSIAAVLSVIALAVSGQFGGAELSVEGVLATLPTVFATGHVVFKMLLQPRLNSQ